MVHLEKKLKKNSLQNIANIDTQTLFMRHPKNVKNWRFFQVNDEKILDLSKFAPKQSQHPQSKKTLLIGIEPGHDGVQISPCRTEGCESSRKLHTLEPPKATPAPNTSSMPLLYLERDVHSPLHLPNVTAKAFSN